MTESKLLGRTLVGLASIACSALLLALPGGASAQPAQTVRVDLNGASSQMLTLPRGKSAVVELPTDARDVVVTDPKVAEIALRTPRRIFVMGMESGQTDAVFFDGSGRRILSLNIRVDADISAVEDTLRRVVPGSTIRVEAAGDSIILTGEVANAADSDKAARVAERYVEDPKMVLNALSIRGKEQVMLKVRVVEVQRTVIKQLGVNLTTVLNDSNTIFGFTTAATFALNGGVQGGIDGIYSDRSDDQFDARLRAFERIGLVRTLAEPNLTAISGESARFLAGGEFPVPVAEDEEGRVTVTFKPFGVGLGFTPVVLSEGRISLRVSTEVSELTNLGAFSLAGNVTLPGLNVRRAETTVELPSGGSLMMAGLLQSRAKQNLDKVPGLGSVPVLGALFRSRDYLNDETELVITVTPYLVKPVSPGSLQTPADGLKMANDMRTIFLGKLNDAYQPGAGGGAYQGPVGPVIE